MSNIQGVEDPFMSLIPLCYTTGEEVVKQPRRRVRKTKQGEGISCLRKRKLSPEQANMLEQHFASDHKLDVWRKDRLASELGLDRRQVAVWFQNRRARWKNKNLEDEFSMLKNELANTINDKCRLENDIANTINDKCRLENEVMKLKEQLNEAERMIIKMAWDQEQPTSSFSMEMESPSSLGELDNMFYSTPQFMNIWSYY